MMIFDQTLTFGNALLLFLLYTIAVLIYGQIRGTVRSRQFAKEMEAMRFFDDHYKEYEWEEIRFTNGKIEVKKKRSE